MKIFCGLVFIFSLTAGKSLFAVDTSVSNSVWLTGYQQSIRGNEANLNNQLLRLPETALRFDWRPEFKMNEQNAKFVVRPRWMVSSQRVEVNGATELNTDYQWQWLDAYINLQGSGDLSVTYGLQNFQWGPAEAASPSNTIFRETVQEKDLLFTTIGRHILRFNYSPSQTWNFVLMSELSESGALQPVAEDKFVPKALLKSEFAWGGGAQYAGLVVGGRQSGRLSFGEYANFEVVEDFTVYFDANHERGSHAWYPVKDPLSGLITMSQEKLNSEQLFSFVTLGARYVLKRGSDFRIEGIWQESGYSTEQMSNRWLALTTLSLPQVAYLSQNASRLARSGLEFPGQQYVLFSVREPNFWDKKDWTVYFRLLQSLKDRSSNLYVASETALGDHATIYFAMGTSTGENSSELRDFTNHNFLAGGRYSW